MKNPEENPALDIEMSFLMSLKILVEKNPEKQANTWITGMNAGFKTFEELVEWRQKLLDKFAKNIYSDTFEYRRNMLVFQLLYNLHLHRN